MGTFQRSVLVIGLFFLLPKISLGVEIVQAKVTRNVDGDTIWAKSASTGEILKIRMMEIDAPEWHIVAQGGLIGQGTFGERAGHYLAKLLPLGSTVYIKNYGRDHYGRVLGTVSYQDRNINFEMVESGWAIPYLLCGGKDCTPDFLKQHSANQYARACNEARGDGKGVFDPNDPLTEMPFEFRLRVQNRTADKWVGDFVTGKYYPPTQYKKIDVCRRVFFSTQVDAKNAGFRP